MSILVENGPSNLSRAEKNDRVRRRLAFHGDDGSAPRHVLHYAHAAPRGARGRREVEEALTGLGFALADAAKDEGLCFEDRREVASPAFDDLTDMLTARLATFSWRYDGWVCAVVTLEDA